MCDRAGRGLVQAARDARYPRHRGQHRHQSAGQPLRHVQAVHQRVRALQGSTDLHVRQGRSER